ncbi:hypothetical protein Hanom_Chr14g01287991 [Helianthus anomalus]
MIKVFNKLNKTQNTHVGVLCGSTRSKEIGGKPQFQKSSRLRRNQEPKLMHELNSITI